MAHDDLTHAEATPMIVHPRTGEVLDPRELSTDTLLEARDLLSDGEREIRSFKRQIDDEIVSRLDHEGRRQISFSDFKVTVNAPTEKVWDVDRLEATLDDLTAEGLISIDKAERCTKVKVEPVWRELKTLVSDPRVSEQISACFEEVPVQRYVRIGRP